VETALIDELRHPARLGRWSYLAGGALMLVDTLGDGGV